MDFMPATDHMVAHRNSGAGPEARWSEWERYPSPVEAYQQQQRMLETMTGDTIVIEIAGSRASMQRGLIVDNIGPFSESREYRLALLAKEMLLALEYAEAQLASYSDEDGLIDPDRADALRLVQAAIAAGKELA
jgi:hypothetical protein